MWRRMVLKSRKSMKGFLKVHTSLGRGALEALTDGGIKSRGHRQIHHTMFAWLCRLKKSYFYDTIKLPR